MTLAGTRLKHHPTRIGLTTPSKAGPVWNGNVRLNVSQLQAPIKWRRPRRIFVCAHGDLFHENVSDEWIDSVFAVMALAPRHTFLVLTKRAARMRAYMTERWQGTPAQTIAGIDIPAGGPTGRRVRVEKACQPLLDQFKMADPDKDHLWTPEGSCRAMQWDWPLPNVWMGVSVEDQRRANERIPDLLAIPAALRWLSCEPLLGRVDLTNMPNRDFSSVPGTYDALGGSWWPAVGDPDVETATAERNLPRIGWVVCGGESGPGARPMHPDWVRSLRDQCCAAGVPYFFKQWGDWTLELDRDRDDPDWYFDYGTIPGLGSGDGPKDQALRFLNLEGGQGFHGERGVVMRRVGKKIAGTKLDGHQWLEFPTDSPDAAIGQ
jgi:protein gp37